MKTVFILFDSLIMKALECYGGDIIKTPNFNRLAEKGIVFDKHYVGSLPCIPARRDLHTGRLNFMHRGWGPLEPFDNSFVRILRENGTYTHMITDHGHYFEEGGLGYHNSFNTWEFIRGQEGDPWKAMIQPPMERFREKYHKDHYPLDEKFNESAFSMLRKQHMVNSEYMELEEDFCTPRCFSEALHFLDVNKDSDDWLLWLECFDPHEPFHCPEKYKLDDAKYSGKILDWPHYSPVKEEEKEMQEIRANYFSLVSMCDAHLGRMLDFFDDNNMWEDTAIILTSDHGFLLGEHQWWAKSRQPYYEEISHIPLIVAHPDYKDQAGTHRNKLTQTPDIMPTILEIFGYDIPSEVQAKSLMSVIDKNEQIHETVMLGAFGGPICATDGELVYYHYPDKFDDKEYLRNNIYEYTLMPTHMRNPFTVDELKTAELADPFDFTKDVPTLKMKALGDPLFSIMEENYGSKIYNLTTDPEQNKAIFDDKETINKFVLEIKSILKKHDAPKDIFDVFF